MCYLTYFYEKFGRGVKGARGGEFTMSDCRALARSLTDPGVALAETLPKDDVYATCKKEGKHMYLVNIDGGYPLGFVVDSLRKYFKARTCPPGCAAPAPPRICLQI